MPPLTAEQLQYIISGVVVLLFGVVGRRVLNVLERFPDENWFRRVEAHMQRGHEHANTLQQQAFRLESMKANAESLGKRVDAIDTHLGHTDATVADHETRIAVLEAKP